MLTTFQKVIRPIQWCSPTWTSPRWSMLLGAPSSETSFCWMVILSSNLPQIETPVKETWFTRNKNTLKYKRVGEPNRVEHKFTRALWSLFWMLFSLIHTLSLINTILRSTRSNLHQSHSFTTTRLNILIPVVPKVQPLDVSNTWRPVWNANSQALP